MPRNVVITGASGSIGRKLRAHFSALGWTQHLLCLNPEHDPDVQTADLSVYDEAWAARFAGADAVIHLAGVPSANATWEQVRRHNIDMVSHVVRAARTHGARRIVFASSNWIMVGYRFGDERLTTDLPPRPLNPYGVSKLVGERIGAAAADEGVSFIALRIGYCQHDPGNRPGPHMLFGTWGQLMWLSDRDLCNGMERAVLAEGVGFAVLNLMSDNPGMRWDIDTTRKVIGYAPRDGAAAIVTDAIRRQEDAARRMRELAGELERNVMEADW
jgi:NAD(P)-dependent dehydrogenase (short-subunit alcohol dehydrogenase family)